MKTLSLLRHAKSSWEDDSLDDFDRPILPKGAKRTVNICQFVKNQALIPEVIFTSTAQRALQTAQIVANETGLTGNIQWVNTFYPGHIKAYLKLINTIDNKFSHAMLIGHNPELSKLAADLLNENTAWWIPTSGLVLIRFKTNFWHDIQLGQGKLMHYIKPKELRV